ncbi:SAM-dependent methyltransferase [Amycolatopsis antarctica]|uniref:SAM-dependent methyltransferase n=1 Tax=Amycolatopsis antarctica TaxID=1854586 RepID=A0A263D527_9PSEU|nr:class I SAM-dependent methyltransferase [Amycolatopsis antarctica]OZM73481.1 SAM-dependent methyltransferase [Amycolatopsis antarctica]
MTVTGAFDCGLLGRRCWLELAGGDHLPLPTDRWRTDPDPADELLLGRCAGPTLDVGCGPGRLTAALAGRGIVTLGIDCSEVAVDLTTRRGAAALRRDVFGHLPGEGRWRHVLLADGNIGIGGDPVALLRRIAGLLAAEGSVVVELETPGRGLHRERVRVSEPAVSGTWFPWAWLGADAVRGVASAAGLRVGWTAAHDRRWFAELEPA